MLCESVQLRAAPRTCTPCPPVFGTPHSARWRVVARARGPSRSPRCGCCVSHTTLAALLPQHHAGQLPARRVAYPTSKCHPISPLRAVHRFSPSRPSVSPHLPTLRPAPRSTARTFPHPELLILTVNDSHPRPAFGLCASSIASYRPRVSEFFMIHTHCRGLGDAKRGSASSRRVLARGRVRRGASVANRGCARAWPQ